jgi:dTDP-4-dehydrorhamnose reductase
MKRIFITGGSGMLGSYVATQAAEAGWETWATYHSHEVSLPGCHMLRLDLADLHQVTKAVGETQPDIIIHAAALSKPDVCATDPIQATRANLQSTVNVAIAAEEASTPIIYVSTDLVFPGGPTPFKERDPPAPLNYYGVTKAAGEQEVKNASVPWAIVRTSIIYGPRMFAHLNSFSDKVIESLRAGTPITAFTDQRRCPIPAWNLADVLLEIADRHLTGIYHAVCPEPSTRYEFAVKVADVFGLDSALIVPKTMDEVPALAHRPNTLILDTLSTQRALNTRLLGFEEGIESLRGAHV